MVGRRGPAQAAFTNPELLELGELEDADVIVDPDELERALAVEDPNMDPTSERNVSVLRDYASRIPGGRESASCSASWPRPRSSLERMAS